MRKSVAALLLCTLFYAGSGQKVIQTERPGEIQSAHIQSRGTFQVEAGFYKEKHKSGDIAKKHPEVQMRYGLNNWLEFRLNLTVETQALHSMNIFRDGFRPIEPGVRIKLFQSRDSSFTAAFQAHAGLPVISSGKHNPGKPFHRMRILMQQSISEKIGISFNAGTDWDDQSHAQNWIYGISPGVQFSERFKGLIELFGYFQEGTASRHLLKTGLAYAFHNDIEIDASAGKGLTDNAPEHFFAIGLSFRLK